MWLAHLTSSVHIHELHVTKTNCTNLFPLHMPLSKYSSTSNNVCIGKSDYRRPDYCLSKHSYSLSVSNVINLHALFYTPSFKVVSDVFATVCNVWNQFLLLTNISIFAELYGWRSILVTAPLFNNSAAFCSALSVTLTWRRDGTE